MHSIRPLLGLILLGSLPLAVGCEISNRNSAPPPVQPQSAVLATEIESALVLDLVPKGKLECAIGETIEFGWTLRNTSPIDPIPVVQGGDGSEAGWREPALAYTVEISDGQGGWAPAPTHGYGRCGMFDPAWQDDIVELSPGASLELAWIPYLGGRHPLDTPGRYRVTAEYRYGGGTVSKGEEVGDIGAMADMPAFTVRSAPVEFTITRP